MREQNLEPSAPEPFEELFEPSLGELSDELLAQLTPVSSEQQCLAKKRRRAEQRLEEKRMRDELGDYDLEFDDY